MDLVLTTIITTVISASVGAVVAAVVSRIKTARRHSERARKDAADLKALIQQNTLMTCRLVIYDDHFSVDEKLDAYKIYRDNGGNHQTKTHMDTLVGGDADEYLARHGI